jgi:peptidoglycan hydrolase CwlO-like protein
MRLNPAARRATAVAVLVLGLPFATASGAGAADPIEQAEQQVASLTAEVDRTAAVLTEGSKKLEEGQAELARVRAELTRTQREAEEALAQAEEARRRLRSMVSAAYRSPVPDGIAMAMTTGPDGFRDAMVARADLERVRGSQSDVLRDANAERVDAEELVRKVDQLEDDAAAREKDLAAQVEKLQAIAAESEKKLTEANTRLQQLREERRRQLEEAAARAARDREAADRVRQLQAAMAGAAATCDGRPAGGQANGFLDPATLCPLSYAPGQSLSAAAAEAFNRMTEHAKATTGSPLCVTDSYRPYADQVRVYSTKPGLAAVPGTSNHGWGLAVDLGCGVERFGSDTHRWMKENAGQFGWVHPAWAQQGGSKPEPWHWEFVGG